MNEFDHRSFFLIFFFKSDHKEQQQQKKTAMIKFIHSYPQFKYMGNSCIVIINNSNIDDYIVYKVLKEREYYGNSISISPLGSFSDSKIFSEKLCTEFLVQNIIY